MATWHSRIARLEAEHAARRAPPAFDSLSTSARLISIYTGIGEPIAVLPSRPTTTKAARRVARIRALMDIACERQLADQFEDLA